MKKIIEFHACILRCRAALVRTILHCLQNRGGSGDFPVDARAQGCALLRHDCRPLKAGKRRRHVSPGRPLSMVEPSVFSSLLATNRVVESDCGEAVHDAKASPSSVAGPLDCPSPCRSPRRPVDKISRRRFGNPLKRRSVEGQQPPLQGYLDSAATGDPTCVAPSHGRLCPQAV